MNNFELRNTDMDPTIVAKTIYWNTQRDFANQMVEMSPKIQQELNKFLEKFSEFVGMKKTSFYRIDAYFNEEKLYILDINASFVDGWWNALNFARATSQQINAILNETMPKSFYLQEQIYRREFELCLQELQELWIEAQEVRKLSESIKTYVYWTIKRTINVFPYDGLRVDNKINLALFSKIWKADNVVIPQIITSAEASWEDIPKDYVLKLNRKTNIENKYSNRPEWWNVKIWKPNKWKWASQKWESWEMIAQQQVETMKNKNAQNMQLILMSTDDNIIAWYTQASNKDIINDNSFQSPLIMK